MKAIICLNGEKFDGFNFSDYSLIIACDGAYKFLIDSKITPNVILGDFDSLGYVPLGALTYPCDKDYTDGELALNFAIEKGYKEIDFAFGGGGREDHFIGNLAILKGATLKNINSKMFTKFATIRYLVGNNKIQVKKGVFVSVAAFEENVIVGSSSGLKYEYNNTKLSSFSTLGISNVALSTDISLNIFSGGVYFFENK